MGSTIKKYQKFKIPEGIGRTPLRELCRPPEKFQLQPQQAFLEAYMGPAGDGKRGMLVFHKIGSGKTCTAIRVAEAWKARKKIVVVLPAFLLSNFVNELMGPCAGYTSLEDVKKHYSILSYQKFFSKLPRLSLKRTLLIIDEVQNVVSESGTFYASLQRKIARAPSDFRMILLSATPIFDRPSEIALTMRLLSIDLPHGDAFDKTFLEEDEEGELHIKNTDLFKEKIRGYVSYYRGMPAKAFPRVVTKVVPCVMSAFQYRSYRAALRGMGGTSATDAARGRALLRLPVSFFLGPRMTCNVAFPNCRGNEAGFESWRGAALTGDKLDKYSVKFGKILRRIKRAGTGTKVFVYSGFAAYGGILSLAAVLEANGYSKWGSGAGTSSKTYAVWSSRETPVHKDRIRDAFNDPMSGLDLLLGSPSIREGVSLRRVEQIHILEPYWNMSRIQQVIGRGSRFCAHADLPPARRMLHVYIYVALRPDEKTFANRKRVLETYSVDRYIVQLAKKKQNLIKGFERLLKEASVDCTLNKALDPAVNCDSP